MIMFLEEKVQGVSISHGTHMYGAFSEREPVNSKKLLTVSFTFCWTTLFFSFFLPFLTFKQLQD